MWRQCLKKEFLSLFYDGVVPEHPMLAADLARQQRKFGNTFCDPRATYKRPKTGKTMASSEKSHQRQQLKTRIKELQEKVDQEKDKRECLTKALKLSGWPSYRSQHIVYNQ
eukprot:TRINITY_DN11954_c0_g1_i3.p2 TRINITY_DN11954_c0_g1~~TRINITY_DN11954_c0_g1_i3.p2  ORF type:complete len:111 (+),score=8.57 TRINITY_DN11954_c0_g1_i3:62-394(+)